MAPSMLGLGLLQITTIVNTRFGSSLAEGSMSYIYFADRLLELPLSLVSVSLGTALLPTLAQFWSEKKVSKMTETAHYYLRLNLYVAVPAATGLLFLADPIVQLLFQRGQFVQADSRATASVVQIYGFILISSSCVRVLVPSFYAIKNTWWPAVASGISLCLHLIIAPLLMKGWGLQGLVSSAFVTGGLNFMLLMIGYRRWIGEFGVFSLLKAFLKFIIAALPMTLILKSYPFWYSLFGAGGTWSRLPSVVITIGCATLSYFLMSSWMQLEEYKTTGARVLGKIKAKLISF